VDGVAFTPGNAHVVLAVSGDIKEGLYTVSIAWHTVISADSIWSLALAPTFAISEHTIILASAARAGLAEITIYFSHALRALAATSVPGNYVITGPSALAVDGVAFTPGNAFVVLTVSGTWTLGTYTVSMPANTIQTSVGGYLSGALAPTVACVERTNIAHPLITMISPLVALGANGEIELEITDVDDFTRIILLAGYPAIERTEAVFDGAFMAPYEGMATPITSGWRLSGVHRVPSWPLAGCKYLGPHLAVYAIDTMGAENP
jgi:hypothetical protein